MQIAAELGIQPSMLRAWHAMLRDGPPGPRAKSTSLLAAGLPVASPSDQAAKIAKLCRELDRVPEAGVFGLGAQQGLAGRHHLPVNRRGLALPRHRARSRHPQGDRPAAVS
jgi:hypothetical protein